MTLSTMVQLSMTQAVNLLNRINHQHDNVNEKRERRIEDVWSSFFIYFLEQTHICVGIATNRRPILAFGTGIK